MQIRDILRIKKTTLAATLPDASIKVAIDLLSEHNIGALPVCDASNKVVGILSERDIVRWLSKNLLNFENVQVSGLMTSDVVTCTEDFDLVDVMTMMDKNGIRHMPVVSDDKLIGMVSSRDILHTLHDDMKAYATKMTLNYEIMR
ncbi:CBS domain-containing protein [Thalassospiraceae bacterium LMO-JJ14]|nr:CBS domain-containing protein [Thalassospiraceae bacterium LMO-JJ14]